MPAGRGSPETAPEAEDPHPRPELQRPEVDEAELLVERPRSHTADEVDPGHARRLEVRRVALDETPTDPLAARLRVHVHVKVGGVVTLEGRGQDAAETLLRLGSEPEALTHDARGVRVPRVAPGGDPQEEPRGPEDSAGAPEAGRIGAPGQVADNTV